MTEETVTPAAPRPLWALALSGLFHPLFVATYMYLILILVNPYLFGTAGLGDSRASATLVMLVLYTAVIPIISVGLMVALDMVSGLMLEDRMERIGPLLLVMILYFWVYWNFNRSNDIPTIFTAFMLGVVLALSLAFVVNVVDKISLHAVGMGGLVAMLMITMGLFGARGVEALGQTIGLGVLVLAGVFLAGLVGSARLALAAHSPAQLYVGYAVGFVSQVIAVLVYF